MKNIIASIILLTSVVSNGKAQETVYPSKENKEHFIITNATVHIGNGQVIENGSVEINNGKIVKVSTGTTAASARVMNASGKHVYPGLILPVTDLGLKEIGSGVRGSNDFLEIGDLNPNVRSIVAYNTDSKFINVLKANGILLAGVTPEGGTITGSSSVVQLDGWNWEDAAYKMDNAIHLNMPNLVIRAPRRRVNPTTPQPSAADQLKEALQKVEEVKGFFKDAKMYSQETNHKETNLKLEAVKGLFNGSQKLFVHANQVKQMLVAIDFAKDFGFNVVIVGGNESYLIADLLKQNNIPVILNNEHRLPETEDEDVDQPYKTPAALQKAGVLFALNDVNEETRYRNLSFNAGTAAAYGLTKEQALQAITLNSAKILGVDKTTGSLEEGKDANIVISDGDILDMKSSIITSAFIQGRPVSLDNKQKQLYERYKYKYSLK
ncbi:amidohydrolase family protein [Segetibacter aerophilus]|uniref:Amidohydrolase n=1 Tax=Segetibacter aerophilus TaxID=670293 RepID=A0A512BCR5_9BACT|nr:amidohydrolase family protein [Segetibacter aerophilus]GEO09762.1 amidohydrolase [Segetibacter aerophilus]